MPSKPNFQPDYPPGMSADALRFLDSVPGRLDDIIKSSTGTKASAEEVLYKLLELIAHSFFEGYNAGGIEACDRILKLKSRGEDEFTKTSMASMMGTMGKTPAGEA